MSECDSPLIICRLTDQNGKLLDPYAPGAITFTELCASQKCTGTKPDSRLVSLLISGYVVVYVQGRELSSPIPFCLRKRICIFHPEDTFLDFQVTEFQCSGVPILSGSEVAAVQVIIEIKTTARSCGWVDVLVQSIAPLEPIAILAQKVYDRVCFQADTSVVYSMLVKAVACQYNALSDGAKRNYTNADELTQYGPIGILSPDNVSFYNLFVNGVLQPTANYAISAGHLDLLTVDTPAADNPVIVSFVTFGTNHGKQVYATNDTYVTLAADAKRVFTNSDELIEYGHSGIPSPDAVSYFNLFINGSLQPKTNYTISEGRLELTTTDLPPSGAMIILESLTIKDTDDTLLKAEVSSFNARSYGNKIYTNRDAISMHGEQEILALPLTSYEHLFVNGVIQPSVNYSVEEGLLTLETLDAPINGAPVTLQFVRVFVS